MLEKYELFSATATVACSTVGTSTTTENTTSTATANVVGTKRNQGRELQRIGINKTKRESNSQFLNWKKSKVSKIHLNETLLTRVILSKLDGVNSMSVSGLIHVYMQKSY